MQDTSRATGSAVTPVADIRSHFPALERRHNGLPVAYFDGPGGTQTPRQVVQAMTDYLYHHNANTHWAYPTSIETDETIAQARAVFADFLNARASEVVFGLNMTTLTFHLARALGREYGPGDEIVVTELDHHGNVAPWQALARERGLILKTAALVPETGTLDWDDLSRKLTARTKILAIGAASNALGTITDVARAARLAHDAEALVFVDAVHFAPHGLPDVEALGADFLACSAYKFYGPHIGILYGKLELLERTDFPKLLPAPDYSPERAETGTQNHEGIAGAAAAVDFLAALSSPPAGTTRRERLAAVFDEMHSRGQELISKLWHGLESIRGVRLYGPPPSEPRTPTVSFTIDGVSSTEAARRLSERAVFVSHGDFYAMTIAERYGVAGEGFVRAGCSIYTTEEEIGRLLDGVSQISK